MRFSEEILRCQFMAFLAIIMMTLAMPTSTLASDFAYPWRDKNRAIVLDAYEKNPIEWEKVVSNKQIRGFIAKASDGLPPPWSCAKTKAADRTLCRKTFQNYWLKSQLYHTRKLVAKSLGLKWGAYHLGRPGNPIQQADHFIRFADPQPDELIALDIEHDDPDKWISLKDAEIFARYIHKRLGRWPVLYTNHHTAQRIAARKSELPVLSRLQLWYARFKADVRGSFPMGHWESYALWQFSAQPNCNATRCLYRVAGTKPDIDVNVSMLSIEAFDKAWPFGGLVPVREKQDKAPELLVSVEPDTSAAHAQFVRQAKDARKLEEEKASLLAALDGNAIPVPSWRDPQRIAKLYREVRKDARVAGAEVAQSLSIPRFSTELLKPPMALADLAKGARSTFSGRLMIRYWEQPNKNSANKNRSAMKGPPMPSLITPAADVQWASYEEARSSWSDMTAKKFASFAVEQLIRKQIKRAD